MNNGWRDTEEVLNAYDDIANTIYELRNCIRTMTPKEMELHLLGQCENLKDAVECIDWENAGYANQEPDKTLDKEVI